MTSIIVSNQELEAELQRLGFVNGEWHGRTPEHIKDQTKARLVYRAQLQADEAEVKRISELTDDELDSARKAAEIKCHSISEQLETARTKRKLERLTSPNAETTAADQEISGLEREQGIASQRLQWIRDEIAYRRRKAQVAIASRNEPKVSSTIDKLVELVDVVPVFAEIPDAHERYIYQLIVHNAIALKQIQTRKKGMAAA